MTTAHRPTFDPARGKEAARGEAYHQRLLPAHKTLKFRQATQGAPNEQARRDLKAELLRKERKHYAHKEGRALPEDEDEDEDEEAPERKAIEAGDEEAAEGVKRKLSDTADADQVDGEAEEDYETKKRRVLAETKDIDALRENTRLDARAFDQFRPVSLDFGDDYGTADVRIGKTRVLAKVSAEVTATYPDRKFDGIFTISTELSPIASPAFEVGRYVYLLYICFVFGSKGSLTDVLDKTRARFYFRASLRKPSAAPAPSTPNPYASSRGANVSTSAPTSTSSTTTATSSMPAVSLSSQPSCTSGETILRYRVRRSGCMMSGSASR